MATLPESRLRQMIDRFEQVEARMGVATDAKEIVQLSRDHAELKRVAEKAREVMVMRGQLAEAEALAAAMTAMGVPADRIYLEPHALHTDENVFNSLRIAQKKGWSRLGIASDRGQALGACRMLAAWHKSCGAFSMDTDAVEQRRSALQPLWSSLRAHPVTDFQPIKARERERARRAQRSERPPSFVLYPLMLLRRALGKPPLQPFHPDETPLITWAEQSIQRRK